MTLVLVVTCGMLCSGVPVPGHRVAVVCYEGSILEAEIESPVDAWACMSLRDVCDMLTSTVPDTTLLTVMVIAGGWLPTAESGAVESCQLTTPWVVACNLPCAVCHAVHMHMRRM